MENHNNNRFNLSFSKMFKSPFNSCKTQNQSSDVINNQNQNPVFTVVQQQQQNPQILQSPHEPFLSPRTIRPLMCKPRCPETFDEMVRENCIITKDSFTPRRKITERTSDDVMAVGRRCPPVSPISPLNNQYLKLQNQCRASNGDRFEKQRRKTTTKKKKKEKCAKAQLGGKQNMKKDLFPPYRLSSYSYEEKEDWFSSDDEREDETETLFSSKSVSFNSLSSKSLSLSSDDESNRRQVADRNRHKKPGTRRRRRRGVKKGSEVDVLPMQEKVKGSFAVVKSSSDPYNDFRISMVEMIIERQIFGVKELENLLHCFLSLNSAHHHTVIVDVFTEIWEALFSNGS